MKEDSDIRDLDIRIFGKRDKYAKIYGFVDMERIKSAYVGNT